MAIVQISRIQIRRGLNQDLPQLASAEMGWSVDTQQLYIGNGTTAEGAPVGGITEILTQHSNILGLVGVYTYQGAAGGYIVTTGVTTSSPVSRSLQLKLDEYVSVKDFGAVGDGVTDDTLAINRAIQQIYNPLYLDSVTKVRRTIKFPAGTYFVSNTISVPPYAEFVGDGRLNTVISSINGAYPVFKTVDSQYNGSGSTKPRDITITDMTMSANAAAVVSTAQTSPIFYVDNCTNAKLVNVRFVGIVGATNNLVYITDSVSATKHITFDNCSFLNGAAGVNAMVQGSGITTVRVNNSNFDVLSNVGYFVSNTVNGFSSTNNYFGAVATPRVYGTNTTHVSFGDAVLGTGSGNITGLILGRQDIGTTVTSTIPTGSATILAQLTNGAGSFDYQLDNGSAYRSGTVKFTVTGSATTFEDDYTETGTSLGGNLFVNNAGYLSCSVNTAAVLKYNLKQYF